MTIKSSMRKSCRSYISVILLLCGLAGLNAQTEQTMTLALDDVIEMARSSALQSLQAKHTLDFERAGFESYLASRKWQLGMSIIPSYQRMSLSPDTYSLGGVSESSSFSAGATLDFQKLVGLTGGYLYASSNFAWSEYFGDTGNTYRDYYGTPRMFGATPLRIGYRQELLGYNGPLWEKRIRDRQIENAGQEYVAALADISEKAAQYFFSYASEKALYDMYRVNASSADSLYKIGLEKYAITSIRKDELLSLQLQLMNSQNDVRSSYNSLEQARRSLLSFLNIAQENVTIDAVLPDNPEHMIVVNPQQAIDMAREYNPVFGQAEAAALIAEQEVDKTKKEKGLQMNLDLSVGLQKHGPDMSRFVSDNQPYTVGNVTMEFPIVDHGLRKNNYNAAKSRLEYYNVQKLETERTMSEAIINTVSDLQMQQQMLAETRKAMELADESFAQNQYNYAQGLSDINTFTLAQNRKDSAHINYIRALSDFWLAYYRLCSLTLYDFYNMKPL